jgi:uncharacterized membrane protein
MRGLVSSLVGVVVFGVVFAQLEYSGWKTPTERKWAAGIAAVLVAALTGFLGTTFGIFR